MIVSVSVTQGYNMKIRIRSSVCLGYKWFVMEEEKEGASCFLIRLMSSVCSCLRIGHVMCGHVTYDYRKLHRKLEKIRG